MEPHHLPHYAQELSTAFHRFYEECRVVSSVAGDEELTEFPASLAALEACEPVYDVMPGWHEPIDAARSLDELPAAARAYVLRLERELGVPVDLVGVGPERDSTIERANPFAVVGRR